MMMPSLVLLRARIVAIMLITLTALHSTIAKPLELGEGEASRAEYDFYGQSLSESSPYNPYASPYENDRYPLQLMNFGEGSNIQINGPMDGRPLMEMPGMSMMMDDKPNDEQNEVQPNVMRRAGNFNANPINVVRRPLPIIIQQDAELQPRSLDYDENYDESMRRAGNQQLKSDEPDELQDENFSESVDVPAQDVGEYDEETLEDNEKKINQREHEDETMVAKPSQNVAYSFANHLPTQYAVAPQQPHQNFIVDSRGDHKLAPMTFIFHPTVLRGTHPNVLLRELRSFSVQLDRSPIMNALFSPSNVPIPSNNPPWPSKYEARKYLPPNIHELNGRPNLRRAIIQISGNPQETFANLARQIPNQDVFSRMNTFFSDLPQFPQFQNPQFQANPRFNPQYQGNPGFGPPFQVGSRNNFFPSGPAYISPSLRIPSINLNPSDGIDVRMDKTSDSDNVNHDKTRSQPNVQVFQFGFGNRNVQDVEQRPPIGDGMIHDSNNADQPDENDNPEGREDDYEDGGMPAMNDEDDEEQPAPEPEPTADDDADQQNVDDALKAEPLNEREDDKNVLDDEDEEPKRDDLVIMNQVTEKIEMTSEAMQEPEPTAEPLTADETTVQTETTKKPKSTMKAGDKVKPDGKKKLEDGEKPEDKMKPKDEEKPDDSKRPEDKIKDRAGMKDETTMKPEDMMKDAKSAENMIKSEPKMKDPDMMKDKDKLKAEPEMTTEVSNDDLEMQTKSDETTAASKAKPSMEPTTKAAAKQAETTVAPMKAPDTTVEPETTTSSKASTETSTAASTTTTAKTPDESTMQPNPLTTPNDDEMTTSDNESATTDSSMEETTTEITLGERLDPNAIRTLAG